MQNAVSYKTSNLFSSKQRQTQGPIRAASAFPHWKIIQNHLKQQLEVTRLKPEDAICNPAFTFNIKLCFWQTSFSASYSISSSNIHVLTPRLKGCLLFNKGKCVQVKDVSHNIWHRNMRFTALMNTLAVQEVPWTTHTVVTTVFSLSAFFLHDRARTKRNTNTTFVFEVIRPPFQNPRTDAALSAAVQMWTKALEGIVIFEHRIIVGWEIWSTSNARNMLPPQLPLKLPYSL